MPRPFRIVCRGSKLSLAQAHIFEKRILEQNQLLKIELIIKETRGDANPSVPLSEMEGKDFFTQDIQDYLLSGQADFAVHSLKDVSGENFFEGTHYAIIERDVPHDVAIFNEEVIEKIKKGEKILVGTSSPRRVSMATQFLDSALPEYDNKKAIVETAPIRGNVDTRLQKLASRGYDGIILACAGLNRLLRDEDARHEAAALLKGKLLMVLPLLHCPPAPGQGAIVVETTPDNQEAVIILQRMNDKLLSRTIDAERKVAHQYGSGCHQQFGVIYVAYEKPFIFAAGRDRNDEDFIQAFSPDGNPIKLILPPSTVSGHEPIFSSHNILLAETDLSLPVGDKRLWVDLTASWFELAKKGFWVEGSLEGMGLAFLEKTLQGPILQLPGKYPHA